ncbi:MAG: UDP-2,3-diacylglucosamine diphosphatase LpxI [Phycisphaeraceae bacterium]
MAQPIGLIAGQGRLPIITAQGIRAAGHPVVCVGLRDQFDPVLPEQCDQFAAASVGHLSKWIRLMKRWGVTQAVMVGRVQKTRVHDPVSMLRMLPDWHAVRLWLRIRHDTRSDQILGRVADLLDSYGIRLIDSTQYIPDYLASEGVLTRTRPTAAQLADIEFALPIVRRMGEWDIGQSIAVKARDVIAVEAMEGTDEMIHRAGQLCKTGGWMLVKVAKPGQDMRFDVPTVGLRTIEQLHAARAAGLAVEAGKVILLDKPELLAAADKAGITIVGVRLDETPVTP